MPFQAESNHRFGRLVPIHSVDNARSRTWTVLWDDWGISEVGASRDRWCSRKSWCDIEGEGIKKWKEALIVLKNNLLYVYKNETVPDLLLAHGSRQNPLRCWSAWISAWSWYFLVYPVSNRRQRSMMGKPTWFSSRRRLEGSSVFPCHRKPDILLVSCRMEELSEWVTDIKGSDYASLKEKVTTLELGLKTIGEGQVLDFERGDC